MLSALLEGWPLVAVVTLFAASTLVIGTAGTRLTRLSARLARRSGVGEALFGAVLLGGTTSLSGIVTSVAAAAQGYAQLAVSNALGGIAAQTAFLALADMAYRRANLEHAAASVENLMQAALLLTLLALPLLAMAAPGLAVGGVHPVSLLLLVAYGSGLRLISRARRVPLWRPYLTEETRREGEGVVDPGRGRAAGLWAEFALLALGVAAAGYLVASTGIVLAARTGLSETLVGGLLTAVSTSLPELVTAVAAVRQGALTLAVGDIIGGNSFDVLFLAFADVSYRQGSIYQAVTDRQIFVLALSQVLTGILLLGLLRREKHGIANIGFESVLVLITYVGGFAVLFLTD